LPKVLIGIQARSGSTRLPRKAFELILGHTMLDRVIETCTYASNVMEKNSLQTQVAVVTPTGDPIVKEFSKRVMVIEGSEFDVLARYRAAVDLTNPDVLIRITGDCPLIPGSLIAYMAGIAQAKGYDYFSNCDERFRTAIDGVDCEVISRRLFDHCAEFAVKPYDREHVTPFIRRSPPEWAKMGLAMSYIDLSGIKLSVDTQEELDRARKSFEDSFVKYNEASKIYGRGAIHRL
jgi:spore coat polysaccharide biosynthesis protein SpsF (cytidylyltransferase family)